MVCELELCPGLRILDRVPGPVLRDSDWPGPGTRVPGLSYRIYPPRACFFYRPGSGKVLKRRGKEVGGRRRLDFVSYCTMSLDK